jgi:hypothetical protein
MLLLLCKGCLRPASGNVSQLQVGWIAAGVMTERLEPAIAGSIDPCKSPSPNGLSGGKIAHLWLIFRKEAP